MSKPEPVQLPVNGCDRVMVVSEFEFVMAKLLGNVAEVVNGPTSAPPVPDSVYVPPLLTELSVPL